MIDFKIGNSKKLILISGGVYVISRIILLLMGVQFVPTFDYMFWLDGDLLQHRLAESLWYAHAFPPVMNAVLGIILKISPDHPEVILAVIYLVWGGMLCVSFTYLLDLFLQINRWILLGIATFFHLSPPFIYFENFLYYTFPSTLLLCGLTILFYKAITHKSFKWWLAFFSVCVLLGLLRATFHLVWLVLVLGIALAFEKGYRITILKGFLPPASILLFFYLKNLFIFGFFGVSSWGGFNLSLNTINRIPLAERQAMADRETLSPLYAFHPYSGPEAYDSLFDLSQKRGIPCLDQAERAVGRPNYNHWIYAEVSAIRMQDSWKYIRQHPKEYLRNVWYNAKQFLGPSTQWHPREPGFSPHAINREKLGRYEKIYNTLLHEFPFKGPGLYVLFPFLLVFWGCRSGIRLLRDKSKKTPMDTWMFFICFNCLFVYLASICLTFGEMARYRFLIEPYVILLYAYTLIWVVNKSAKISRSI